MSDSLAHAGICTSTRVRVVMTIAETVVLTLLAALRIPAANAAAVSCEPRLGSTLSINMMGAGMICGPGGSCGGAGEDGGGGGGGGNREVDADAWRGRR